ncbi:prephenate dehydrogenase [Fructilactobacillus vespulae]|uniref:prephenate dehydrogenase n=1 Tax=Fructilactobacillus vespulae TaxID=1249630 RepID=UPI0039B3D200
MKTVLVKVLGLIGSSLIRGIKINHPEYKIIGLDENQRTIQYALNHGLIDEAATDLTNSSEADFIILATPVSQIIIDIAQLSKLDLKKDVVVTDVGSTKQLIMKTARKLDSKHITFVGGHPMAGSHKTGVTAGKANLFENAFYFQISGKNTEAAQKIQKLLVGTKAKWLKVNAKQHDKIVAQISHLPHIIAAGLVNQTNQEFSNEPLGMELAAGGFKSITRIASADPVMWKSILLSNQEIILQQLKIYQETLNKLAAHLKNRDEEEVESFFATAKFNRDKLKQQKHSQTGFFDLFLDIPDQRGELAKITKQLAEHKISLVNIHILEIREDVEGILQLTFSNETDLNKARMLLSSSYKIVRR